MPKTRKSLAILCGATLAAAAAALAQPRPDDVPAEFEGVGVAEKLGAQLPLDLRFFDEREQEVRLGDFFGGRRPVILTLNYFACESLCDLQLNGLVDALRRMDWIPGREFEILSLSFDPLEKPSLARAKKRAYLDEYGRPGAAAGWHFLTGRKDQVRALTDAVGFTYRWNERTQQWAHSAALILCSPSGKVSRYIGGILFEPETLRLSLVEASEGKVGSFADFLYLTCFRYESTHGRYVWAAVGAMRAGGTLTVAALAVALAVLWRRDASRRRAAHQTILREVAP